jgi:hypothetical protein
VSRNNKQAGKEKISQVAVMGLNVGLKRQNFFSDSFRKVYEDKMAFMVEVVFSALIYDSNKVVLGGSWIRKKAIHLPRNQRGFIVGIIDA